MAEEGRHYTSPPLTNPVGELVLLRDLVAQLNAQYPDRQLAAPQEQRPSLLNPDDLGKGLHDYLDAKLLYARTSRMTRLAAGTKLFRARENRNALQKEGAQFPLDKMGAPPHELATPGRINPEGVPYLYMASDASTAIAEVRPWTKAWVTVAEFKLLGETTIVDATGDPPYPNPRTLSDVAWEQLISHFFSTPIPPNRTNYYLLTQFLSESFKRDGFHGIRYLSGLSESGVNVALFDPCMALGMSCQLYEVKRVDYEAHLVSD